MPGGGSKVAAVAMATNNDLLLAAQRLDDCTRAWRRAAPQDKVLTWCAMIRSLLDYLDARDEMDPPALYRGHGQDPDDLDM